MNGYQIGSSNCSSISGATRCASVIVPSALGGKVELKRPIFADYFNQGGND